MPQRRPLLCLGTGMGGTCQQMILVGAMGMPQSLAPEVAPAFCLSCGRPNLTAWWGRRQTCQRQPWRALWVCRNTCRGFTGCSCLLRILPEAQCYSLVMAKHGSYNLGGRYGYAATPWAQGLLLPIVTWPDPQPATTLVGAMGMPQPLGPGAAPAFRLTCRGPNLIA